MFKYLKQKTCKNSQRNDCQYSRNPPRQFIYLIRTHLQRKIGVRRIEIELFNSQFKSWSRILILSTQENPTQVFFVVIHSVSSFYNMTHQKVSNKNLTGSTLSVVSTMKMYILEFISLICMFRITFSCSKSIQNYNKVYFNNIYLAVTFKLYFQ